MISSRWMIFSTKFATPWSKWEANIADLTKKHRRSSVPPVCAHPRSPPLPLRPPLRQSDLIAPKAWKKPNCPRRDFEDAKKRAEAIVKEATPDPEVEMLTEQRNALKSEIAELEGQLEAFRSRMQSFFTQEDEQ